MKQLRALAWRVAPDLCHVISLRLPGLRAYWFHGRRRRRGRSLSEGPVIVAGFHGAVLGLGEAARGTVTALAATGIEAQAWDVSAQLGHVRRFDIGEVATPPPGPGTIITQMNPAELIRLVSATRGAPFEGKRSIGYWAWELMDIPEAWKPAFRYVDEIWTPSNFCAEAIRRSAPRDLPIKVVPHQAPLNHAAPNRERFGLSPDHVVVLCAFDLRSTLARKNPLGALEAFRIAAAKAKRPVTLVFKTVGGADAPDSLATLRAAIGDTPDVLVLTESLSMGARDQLMASCDIFLSLHRSEGFGLLLAEAMAAGKAVVATGWSANMDFMDAESAMLVPYALCPVRDPQGLYQKGVWAEPDTEAAGRALAELINNPDQRAELGAKALAAVRQRLSPPAIAAIMRRAFDGSPVRKGANG
uniref:Glycosyl transferase group 1 n=1 Tax=Caulobacter sp. (strain K31) TaxID=366602 RepID=B0T5B5_CAUSK